MDKRKMTDSAARSFTRLSRFIDQLARGNLASGPVTLQQCHTLDALHAAPLSMGDLAAEVGIHQSTMTRIVEKLEKSGLARRKRVAGNQRSVVVELTAKGAKLTEYLIGENRKLAEGMLGLIPAAERAGVVKSLETITELFSPSNPEFMKLLENCCRELSADCGGKR